MKRKAPAAFHENEKDAAAGQGQPPAPRLDDCFLAAEILPRLPAHAAQAFSAANPFFRGILTDPDFWLAAPRRAPPPPHAACLVVRGGGGAGEGLLHEFHYADAGFTAEPAVVSRVTAGGSLAASYRCAGACNGLVLLATPCRCSKLSCAAAAVLFNPASGEEAALACGMPRGRLMFHLFCGLGYSPSSKSYKALLCAHDFGLGGVELMVVQIGGGGAGEVRRREPRRVAVGRRRRCYTDPDPDPSSLSLDGKVYILLDTRRTDMLAFDVDEEKVTFVDMPSVGRLASELMEVWGRPCIAIPDISGSIKLWTLTPEHRWELRCSFAAVRSRRRPTPGGAAWRSAYVDWGDMVHGAWDCGDGRLFVMFRDERGCLYELRETMAVAREVDGTAAVHNLVPAELRKATFCWGYQPTLVPPATVLGDAACPIDERDGLGHFSSSHIGPRESAAVVRRDRCLESLMEMMRKRPQRGADLAASVKHI
ncbi:unnamed protein product [Urochloa decumbens]|uniref:Uncharacterized protein n=1 Tax=Urochloa decumbens TaxID=240449 RepID=A0ABC9B8H8_9POAL